jgi:hypothetical protein
MQPLAVLASGEFTIINHYPHALQFMLSNPEVVPDLQEQFTLPVNGTIKSRVIKTSEKSSAYLYTQDETDDKKNAFFAAEDVPDGVKIHGYRSVGIAYSWNTNTVIICSPEEYKKHHGCV